MPKIVIEVRGCRKCIEQFSQHRECSFDPEYIDHDYFNPECPNLADKQPSASPE